jgi:hypothetical protein
MAEPTLSVAEPDDPDPEVVIEQPIVGRSRRAAASKALSSLTAPPKPRERPCTGTPETLCLSSLSFHSPFFSSVLAGIFGPPWDTNVRKSSVEPLPPSIVTYVLWGCVRCAFVVAGRWDALAARRELLC